MKISRFTKSVVLLNCSVPAILLAWDASRGELGANPVNFAIRTTGLLALIFLLLSLTITPVSRLAGWSWLGQFRRVAGLYAFFHTALHFLLFFAFDRAANVGDTVSEIFMRPYLLVGIVALIIMVPLAVTSTDGMIRRLGPKRWKFLHRFAYLAAIAGALHFYMLVKADTTRPLAFASILALLLGYRLVDHYLGLRSDSRRLRMGPVPGVLTTPSVARQWTGVLRVAKIFAETPEVRTFRLTLPEKGKLPFEHRPGQYLNLTLEIDGRKVRRSYTIASSPSRNYYCELSVKREQNGLASRYLHDTLREGDLLAVSAPAGRFTFTGMEADRIVFIAGGVGITPLMAKIRYLTDLAWTGSMHLIFSVKSERDIIFRSELEELQKRFSNLTVTVTITRDADPSWSGERGRITASLLQRVAPDVASGRVHLCGPTEMTDPIIALLREMGVPETQIKVESFASPSRGTTSEVATAEANSSAPNEDATLQFARSNRTVSDLRGRTVLEIAEENGIDIPYDCRSGVCGQCKTRLLAGTVSMEAKDALEASEIANGIILSCQARCQDEVVLDA